MKSIVVALVLAVSTGAEAKSVYEVLKSNRLCLKSQYTQQTECSFKAGYDLELTIASVGKDYAATVINKSKYDGDFYASTGLAFSSCIMVQAGANNPNYKDVESPDKSAFISMKDGQVYKNYRACQAAKFTP